MRTKEQKYRNAKFSIDKRYSFYGTKTSYGDVDQTWVLVHSVEMAKKQKATFQRKIEKELSSAKDSLITLGTQSFAYEADAIRESEKWISKQKWCVFETVEIITKETRSSGNKGEKLHKNYFVRGTIILDSEVVEREKLGLGRFILATNDLSLSPIQILTYYKNQSKVEKYFRFIKSNELRIPEVLLKKRERIHGLLCLMGLATLVSSLLEARFSDSLKKTGKTINNQLNEPTDNPTIQTVLAKLKGIYGMVETKMVSGILDLNSPCHIYKFLYLSILAKRFWTFTIEVR
ncbi:MAG: IS1634 family transposase [Deltaproteobacteria bacterium]|jgi:transposase|nr:IS1634 family transposase [Deltaproteobacteria bacterium]